MADSLVEKFEAFKDLATREITEGVKKAMRKSAREIQKRTKENARAGIQSYNNHPDGEYEEENILDAVRVTKLNEYYDNDEMWIKVHVLGTFHEGSKTFRFRFLEKGTKDRYAKTQKGKQLAKPRYLGKISPRRYFSQARDSVNIQDIYLQELEKAIDEVNKQ